MRLIADANMESRVVTRLREASHDVFYAREVNPTAPDIDLLRQAAREQRTLFTFDMDFGELVHLHGEPAPYGVIQFRLHKTMPSEAQVNFISDTVVSWEWWPPGVWTIQIRHRSS